MSMFGNPSSKTLSINMPDPTIPNASDFNRSKSCTMNFKKTTLAIRNYFTRTVKTRTN